MNRSHDLVIAFALAVMLHGAALFVMGLFPPPAVKAETGGPAADSREIEMVLDEPRAAVVEPGVVPDLAAAVAQAREPTDQPLMPDMPALPMPEARTTAPVTVATPIRITAGATLPTEVVPVPAVNRTAVGAGAGDRQPSLAHLVRPAYPYGARRRNEAGRVTLAVSVDNRGAATEVKVTRSSGFGDLDLAAANALRQARFRPAIRDGQTVASECEIVFEFRLEDK